jgi:hypothetical protein
MSMGKIRRAIADLTISRSVYDKRHHRFLAGYLAGQNDARLEAKNSPPTQNVDGSQKTVAVDREVLRDIAQLLSGSMFTFVSTEEKARERGAEIYALLATAEGSAHG